MAVPMSDVPPALLDDLYRGVVDDDQGLACALDRIQSLFACRAASLLSIDPRSPPADVALTSGVLTEYLAQYRRQFAAIDPAPALFARLRVGTASTTDRIMSDEARRNDVFANEFFLPIGFVETMGGNLFSDQPRFAMIGLLRGKDRLQFDDEDIARLERLMPHLSRALQLRRTFFQLDAANAGLRAVLDRLHAGIVVLRTDGTASFVNAAMRAMVRHADGLSLDRGGCPLPAGLAARRRFDRLRQDVLKGGAGGMLSVPRPSAQRDFVMLVAPAPSTLPYISSGPGGSDVLVIVHDPATRSRTSEDILQEGLNLPAGAARLVAALAADDDLKSFAEREGVTIHTARFHLRTALTRTGARSQVALVRLAIRLLRDVSFSEQADGSAAAPPPNR
jgi:PAS domain-containing protein